MDSRLWYIAICFVLPILLVHTCARSSSKIYVRKNSVSKQPEFVDHNGSVKVFHGINCVKKGFPWYPEQLLNQTYVKYLSEWGFNVVRLGMMWSGVEVKPFRVNQTYIDVMKGIVSQLGQAGLYVILDLHQDAMSGKFDSYDGVPRWLVDSFPPPKHPYPWPFHQPPSNWYLNYYTSECGESFEHLYTNTSRALDHLVFFWQTVAKEFSSYDNLLGYEIINEPFPGDITSNPSLLVPGNGGKVLLPFYDAIFEAIDAIDNTSLIFYEPVTWGVWMYGDKAGTGFSRIPGGMEFNGRAVLSFHYYCPFVKKDNDKPYSPFTRFVCDKTLLPSVLSSVQRDVTQTGGGAFLTEFGLCQGSKNHATTEYLECSSVLDHADSTGLSWTYWDSEFFYANGSIIRDNVQLFSRTYATSVAGLVIQNKYHADNCSYSLHYRPSADRKLYTTVYVSSVNYPEGFNLTVENGIYKVRSHFIEIQSLVTKELVRVEITKIER